MKKQRLLEAIILRRNYGVVEGFFGGGKTYSVMKVVKSELEANRNNILIIYAAPLRKLRDFVADVWLSRYGDDQMFIYRAHDEVCLSLRRRIEEARRENSGTDKKSYYTALSEHLREDECLYRSHFHSLMEFMDIYGHSRIIVTTHDLAIGASLIAHAKKIYYVAVFDEAEDYLEKLGKPFPREEIDSLKEIDRELYRRIKRFFQRIGDYYWIRFETLEFILNNVIVTATLPRSLYYFLRYKYIVLKKQDIPHYRINTVRSRDEVYVLKKIIPSTDITNISLHAKVARLAEHGVANYKAVGIIAKNKEHEKLLYHMFHHELGYRVSCELYSEKPDPDAEVYILTPGGKWYRGVSIYNNRTGKDIPFIIAFYQGGRPVSIHPVLHRRLTLLFEDASPMYSDIKAFKQYAMEMNYAKNLQSVYRYNRERRSRHIMILLDERWVHAYRYYHRRKWQEMKKHVFTDTEDLVKKVVDT